jgi:hypothetical protein
VDSLKDVVQYQQNKIDQVSKLCTLLMDDRFDKVEGLDLQLEKIIKKEICSRCSKENCNIALSKYLSGYLSSNEKGEIVNNCLYPFQIQKAINSSNKRIIEYRDREEKSVESKKIMNNTYQIIKKFIDIKPKNKITSNIYKVEYEKITTQAESSPNGDYCKMFVNDGNEMVILSDGMGHTNKSKDISEYLVELVNYLSVIYNNVNEAIEASNKILIAKTYEEVYATLDIADFDLEIGKVSIYKAGSFPTYIIRNKKIREIRAKLPPVGIINSINVEPEIIDIQHNDILLFLTDGYGDNIAEIIEKTIQKASFLPLKSYLKFLNKKLNENLHINDDQTIVGIKVIKI